MNKADWPVIKRTLLSGWPMARGETIDDDAYIGLLSSFDAEDVKAAIHSLLASSRFMPKVAEIVQALPAKPRHEGLTAAQKREMAKYEARANDRFNALPREVQEKVMGDIERQHGKQFVRRNFPEWKREVAA